MHDDPLPLAATLRVAAEITAAKLAGADVSDEEAAEVLDALHGLDAATTPTHDQLAEHFGLIDDSGRCECGRLVILSMWRLGHKEGPGCMSTVPGVAQARYVGWAWRHPEGVPFLGNVLVRRRLRRERRAKAAMNGQHP
jgi:hypothetical protein